MLDLAQRIIRLAKSSSQITHHPERPGDVRHSRASAEKLAATGFRPVSTLDQGLTETLTFFRGEEMIRRQKTEDRRQKTEDR